MLDYATSCPASASNIENQSALVSFILSAFTASDILLILPLPTIGINFAGCASNHAYAISEIFSVLCFLAISVNSFLTLIALSDCDVKKAYEKR